MPDLDDPAVAAGVTLMIVAVIVIAVAMDMRRLPLGRIKYVPWTYITITAVIALIPAGRHLLAVLLR